MALNGQDEEQQKKPTEESDKAVEGITTEDPPKSQGKVHSHAFLDRHSSVTGAVVLMLISYGLMYVYSLAIGLILGLLLAGSYPKPSKNVLTIILSLSSFLLLKSFRKWYDHEYEGSMKGGCIRLGFGLNVTGYAFLILELAWILAAKEFRPPPFASFAISLNAGLVEETIFRAIPVSYMMRFCKDEKRIPAAAVVSAIAFGLFHLLNIIEGATVGGTINQIIFSFGLGLFHAAVFLRCGNIVPCFFLHTMIDLVGLTNSRIPETGLMVSNPTLFNYQLSALLMIVFSTAGFYLMRPSKRGQIITIWGEKWKRL